MATPQEVLANIHWLGHDSFKIVDDKIIYIDPWKLKRADPANLILVTHDHGDHLSPADIKKIRTKDTVVVTIAAGAKKLSGPVRTVKPGDRLTVQGIEIEAVPAYNVSKFRAPGQPFHPRQQGHVGFIVTVDGVRIYHTGDTDVIPEMEGLDVDIMLVPVSGTYVMTAEEGAEAARIVQPKIAVPMHYGAIVGSDQDARRFKKLCQVPVHILKRSE